MQGKTARIWRAFGGERDNSRQKSRFRERKVARKPAMLPQTNLLKCMRSSWQFKDIKIYRSVIMIGPDFRHARNASATPDQAPAELPL